MRVDGAKNHHGELYFSNYLQVYFKIITYFCKVYFIIILN